MPNQNQAVLDFLAKRRSIPAKTFTTPVPSPAEIEKILTIALRVPDHGKLEPWRLIVLGRQALASLAELAELRAKELGYDDEKTAKGRSQYDLGHLAIAVISSPKTTDTIPVFEQKMSAAALCMNILHAATAAGWAACWLSGWPLHDQKFCENAFDCSAEERAIGLIHIASPTLNLPERPRPKLSKIVSWRMGDA